MTACDPLTREECTGQSPCWWHYIRADVVHTAPPLSPTEQATVDRFEAAPDGPPCITCYCPTAGFDDPFCAACQADGAADEWLGMQR